MHTYSFEKLNVWQNTREFTKKVYLITHDFPADEKFGLVSQIRRAVISISSNIAEGSSRSSLKDQAHFYNMAYSSALEVISQLMLSLDLQLINETTYTELREALEQITNQLNALVKSLRKANN
jgi:four helix bundle protein